MSVSSQTVGSVQPVGASSLNRLGKSAAKRLLLTGIYLVGVGLIWQLIYLLMVEVFQIWNVALFPSPLDVIAALADHLSDGTMGRAISTSLLRLFFGFGIALPLGVMLGLSLSRNHWVRLLLGPLVVGFQALPSICWLPLAILWFGLNERAIIFVVVMGSVFSITAATYDGTKLISPLLMRAATNMGVRGWKMFWRVVLPAALPAILSGTRQGWSFAWRSLLAGELLTAGHGLGNLLNQGRDLTDMALVMAVMVVIIMLGLAVDLLVLTNFELVVRRRYGLMNQL